ncbi:MAG: hypothetical protein ACQR33_01140 [Candidatus Saccharibacteria bacterium]
MENTMLAGSYYSSSGIAGYYRHANYPSGINQNCHYARLHSHKTYAFNSA